MDLGCLDMGCISVDKQSTDKVVDSTKDGDVTDAEPVSASSSSSSFSSSKSFMNKSLRESLNKFTSQIKKPPHRKNSPINWFPRKKMDSYLNRKIKMLQDVAGMNLTLDETLDDTNPHYSRVLREKIAAREAAHKAMEARKAALVEASWCRILHAARIQCREAEDVLSKAEKAAGAAFEAARAMGVIMYDQPNSPKKTCQVEASSSVNGVGHTVTASFETPFEVDKQVAAAVKTAFIRIGNSPSFRKDEFKDLLWKISQNPGTGDDNPELAGSSEFDTMSHPEDFQRILTQSFEKLMMEKLIDMMIDRLKCLCEDELSSLATIVATCGLNAALAQVENNKLQDPAPRRISSFGSSIKEIDGTHFSNIPDLGTVLIKHTSRLQKEIEEVKRKNGKEFENIKKMGSCNMKEDISEVPSLDKFLVKHTSRLQKEIEEAKRKNGKEFENIKKMGSCNMKEDVSEVPSLDKFLMKHVSRLEKEVHEARKNNLVDTNLRKKVDSCKENFDLNNTDCESLDKVLVKHVSRLEKEKMKAADEQVIVVKSGRRNMNEEGISLEQILVKHNKPRIDKEKIMTSDQEEIRRPVSRREARDRELQEAWGGLSLGNSIKPHVSKLEREKAAWVKAEEEERRQASD